MRRAALFLFGWLIATGSGAQDKELATIPLHHRVPEEVARVIEPLLETGDVVIPNRASLIVKASPSKLTEINALVGELDKPQHRLLITVVQGQGLTVEQLNARAHLNVRIDPRHPEDVRIGGRGHLYQSEDHEAGENTQRVQTLDGQAAHITFGSQVALPSGQNIIQGLGGPVLVNPGIEYREVSTGFAVIPYLSGAGQVRLDIAPWSDRLSRRGGGIIETQEARTTLQTQLGAWVELGGEVSTREQSSTGLFGHRYSTRSDTGKIFLKVEDLDAGAL